MQIDDMLFFQSSLIYLVQQFGWFDKFFYIMSVFGYYFYDIFCFDYCYQSGFVVVVDGGEEDLVVGFY